MGSQHERAIRKPAQPAGEAVEQFFQVSLLGLLVSGFLALAFSGYLDVLTIVLTSLGLLVRAVAVFGQTPGMGPFHPDCECVDAGLHRLLSDRLRFISRASSSPPRYI